MRRLPALLCTILCTIVLSAACSEPPQKEMTRAQGAIDTARSAGADQYATESFGAATSALRQAQEAIDQRDYRLALTRAVDATDRAEQAAKEAIEGKSQARRESEAAVNAVNAELPQLQARIKAAEAARLTKRDLEEARTLASNAAAALQKARALLAAGSYKDAQTAVEGLEQQIRTQILAVSEATTARSSHRAARPR